MNGAKLGVANRPGRPELERPLRCVALSDSPVLIRAAFESDRAYIASRLHALGRRCALPLHVCRSEEDATALMRTLGDACSRGTWELHSVASWSLEAQQLLARLIAKIDEHRLQGRLAHEEVPRILVLESPESHEQLDDELKKRLSFFDVSLS